MAHYSRLYKILVDAPPETHDEELAFWQGATGSQLTQLERHPEYHGGALPGGELWLLVQRLDEGPARLHLDIHTDDLAAEVARLERLGARRAEQVHGWQVMRDPAGLPFCVLQDPPGTLHDGNAQRWE